MNTRIAIVGGGVAAYTAIETLRRSPIAGEIKILWIAPQPNFVYKPYFFDVLSGYRTLTECVFPLKGYCQRFHIDFYASTLERFDPENSTLYLASGRNVNYEYLILASGEHRVLPEIINNQDSFLQAGTTQLSQLMAHIEKQFIAAKSQLSLLRKSYLSIVVEGRDWQSVSTLLALYNYTEFLRKKYEFRRNEITLTYVSAEKQFGGDLPLKMSDMVEQYARDHMIDIQLHVSIKSFQDGKLVLTNGAVIETHTFVTAGVATLASPYSEAKMLTDDFGGMRVNNYLQIENLFNVYACGSIVNHYDWHKKERVWHSFPVAEAQAKVAANNVIAEIRGRNKQAYVPQSVIEFLPVSDQLCIGIWGDIVYFNSMMAASRKFLAKKYLWQLTMPE